MMVKKEKKQSRSQSSTEKKTLEPKLLSIFSSKVDFSFSLSISLLPITGCSPVLDLISGCVFGT